MVIGSNPQRDQRRRRALVDDRRDAFVQPVQSKAERPARRYTSEVARDRQLRLVDLVPQRKWTLLVWHLVIAIVFTGHVTFAVWEHQIRQSGWPFDLSPLRVDTQQPLLATWTSAIALLATCGYAALILHFRRHKTDDYRGRYRVWYPVVGVLAIAAAMIGSGLSHSASSVLQWAWQSIGVPIDSVWLTGLTIASTVLIGSRLLLEVWSSRGASVLLVAAGICLVAIQLLSRASQAVVPAELIAATGTLLHLAASLVLLLTSATYARFILLDAQGRIHDMRRSGTRRWQWKPKLPSLLAGLGRRTAAKGRPGTDSQHGAPSEASNDQKAQPASTTRQTGQRPSAGSDAKSTSQPGSRNPDPDQQGDKHSRSTSHSQAVSNKPEKAGDAEVAEDNKAENLSRAERKRLRKEKRRQRRAA